MNIDFELLKYKTIKEEELIKKIKDLNNDKKVTSVLVQLPLPKEINEKRAQAKEAKMIADAKAFLESCEEKDA